MLVLDHAAVRELLPMQEAVGVVREALLALARDEPLQPLRSVTLLPEGRGALAAMPVVHGDSLAVKVITVLPGNRATGLDTHQGAVLLFEGARGRLEALLDASELTAVRTAAASAVATDALARRDATVLAMLGAGTQARTHLEAMLVVRPFREVRVWSRTRESAETFVEDAARRRDVRLEAVGDARAAVEGADVTCTTTSSPDVVLRGEWLSPGCHVNAVGACTPRERELDAEALRRSRLFVDSRSSALAESGDVLQAISEGAIGDDPVEAELGDVLLGRNPGRRSPEEITLFESLGLAVEDLAAASHVVRRARERGAGIEIDLGGGRG